MLFLRQSTASQEVLLGPFVDDTDGKTAETALSIANTDIKLWVEGATTEASKTSGGATHLAAGRYYAVLDATDTATVGKLEINVHVAGALPVRREFHVLEEAVYDSLFAAAAAGYQVPIWAASNSTVNLSGTTVKAVTDKVAATIAAGDIATDAVDAASVKADAVTKIQNGLATPTNITAGTITTVTNLTNAPTAGDLTATMKTSVNTEVAAALGTYDGPTNAEMVARTIAAADYATAAELAKVPKSDGTATWNSTALASINAEADTALSDYGALKPTTAGRTLDVTATGAAGIDWANVENPTTTVGLSGTTVKTATDVEADTADIQSRLPAALTGAGNMKSDPQAFGGETGGIANFNDSYINGWDNTLKRWNRVASTDSAEALSAAALASINTEADTALTDYGALKPTDAGRTLDVSAAGGAGLDWSNIHEPTTTVNLSGTTVKTATDVQTDIATVLAKLQGLVLEAATIGGTGNSTTAIHLPGLTYGDDEINSYLLVIYDVSEDEYHARWITDWVASTAVATVATLPFTPQDSTDTYWLLSARADVTGGSGLDAAGVRSALGMSSANLDTQLGDIPTVSEFNARTIASASYATATALGTTDTAVQTLTTRVGIPAVSVADDLAAVKTDTGNLVTRITSTLFSGITSLAQWIGALAGKQVADSTARTEIRTTGAGSGTFDETTDSMQAVRDRGDAAWTTATGFAVPGSEMGLADGAITAPKIGTGAIAAAKFAAGAIDAAALNADAVAEIQSGLSTLTAANVLAKVIEALDTGSGNLDDIADLTANPGLRVIGQLLYQRLRYGPSDTTTQLKIKDSTGSVVFKAPITSATGSVSIGPLVQGP